MSKNKFIDLSALRNFKKNIIDLISNISKPSTTTSLTVTEEGVSALDGTVGKVLNDKFGGCSFEQDGEEFFIVGADSVRKKLGSSESSNSIKTLMVVTGSTSSSNAFLYIYGTSIELSQNMLSGSFDTSGYVNNEFFEISYSRHVRNNYTLIPHKKCILTGFFIDKTGVINMEAEEQYNWPYGRTVRFVAIIQT